MWEYYNMFCWFLQSVPVIFYNRGARLTSPVFLSLALRAYCSIVNAAT